MVIHDYRTAVAAIEGREFFRQHFCKLHAAISATFDQLLVAAEKQAETLQFESMAEYDEIHQLMSTCEHTALGGDAISPEILRYNPDESTAFRFPIIRKAACGLKEPLPW